MPLVPIVMATTDAPASLVTKERIAIKVIFIRLLIGFWVMFALMLVGWRKLFLTQLHHIIPYAFSDNDLVVLENTNKIWFYDVGVKTLLAC